MPRPGWISSQLKGVVAIGVKIGYPPTRRFDDAAPTMTDEMLVICPFDYVNDGTPLIMIFSINIHNMNFIVLWIVGFKVFCLADVFCPFGDQPRKI